MFRPKNIRFVQSLVAVPKENALYEAEVVSGVPPSLSKRTARIYKPTKSAMQSGVANTKSWRIDFDVEERWENELMGWNSSADPVQALKLNFKTKEDAILFARRQGYDFVVEEPKEAKFGVKNYAKNFKYNPKKLTWHHTK